MRHRSTLHVPLSLNSILADNPWLPHKKEHQNYNWMVLKYQRQNLWKGGSQTWFFFLARLVIWVPSVVQDWWWHFQSTADVFPLSRHGVGKHGSLASSHWSTNSWQLSTTQKHLRCGKGSWGMIQCQSIHVLKCKHFIHRIIIAGKE